MILMSIKLDNVGQFSNFSADFTYQRKTNNYALDSEFLEHAKNFRYKKLVILMGPNASGKTSLGRAIIGLTNLIFRQKGEYLIDMIADKNKHTHCEIELVLKQREIVANPNERYSLNRFVIDIPPAIPDTEEIPLFKATVSWEQGFVHKNDTYEKAKKRLKPTEHASDAYANLTNMVYHVGWLLSIEENGGNFTMFKNLQNPNILLKIMTNLLKSFDPSIVDVSKLYDGNGKLLPGKYLVRFPSNSVVIQANQRNESLLLSRGTKSGIEIAEFVDAVLENSFGFYYCDEKFAYVQSDLEQAVMLLMATQLGDCEQMFFTTHNSDILDLDLPRHTYMFLTKSLLGHTAISLQSAEQFASRSDKSLRRFVENDVFMTRPNLRQIIELEDLANDRKKG